MGVILKADDPNGQKYPPKPEPSLTSADKGKPTPDGNVNTGVRGSAAGEQKTAAPALTIRYSIDRMLECL